MGNIEKKEIPNIINSSESLKKIVEIVKNNDEKLKQNAIRSYLKRKESINVANRIGSENDRKQRKLV